MQVDRARVVNDYLQRHHIVHMPWLAMSPDLSPVEHVWGMIGRRQRQPTTLQELAAALQEEWDRLSQFVIGRLIRSMPRRIAECLRIGGAITHY